MENSYCIRYDTQHVDTINGWTDSELHKNVAYILMAGWNELTPLLRSSLIWGMKLMIMSNICLYFEPVSLYIPYTVTPAEDECGIFHI